MAKQWTKLMTGILNRSSATRPILCVLRPVLKRNANIHCLAKQVRSIRSICATHKLGLRTFETASDEHQGSTQEAEHVILLRGFPYREEITPEKIYQFLPGINIVGGAAGMHVAVVPHGDNKPPSVQMYIEVESREDVEKAQEYNGNFFGSRFIEVYESSVGQMKNKLQHYEVPWCSNYSVRVTGLPIRVTENDVKDFFPGLDIRGISPYYKTEQHAGTIVHFTSEEERERALKFGDELGSVKVEPISAVDVAISDFFLSSLKDKSKHSNTDGNRTSERRTGSKLIIRLLGIPFTATVDDVLSFIGDDVKVIGGKNGVYMLIVKGYTGGEAFVEVASMEDVEKVKAKDKLYMEDRYITIAVVDEVEMCDFALPGRRSLTNIGSDVVKLYGTPFRATEEDITDFFKGLEIAPGGIKWTVTQAGIEVVTYVQFTTTDDAEKALERHMKYMGKRYIEVFRSSRLEADLRQTQFTAKEENYALKKFGVFLRGLPFGCTQNMILKFFSPLVPTRVDIKFNSVSGRADGTANVYFTSPHDVDEALKKDYQYIEQRYIEVSRIGVPY